MGDINNEVYVVTGLDDAERTDFMFSDFPADPTVNPKHWETKMNFWKTEIEKMCRFYGDFCVNCEKLKAVFRDKDRRSPKGLITVIGDLYQCGEFHMRSSYIDLCDDTWGQWSYNLAKKSTLWVYRKAVYGGYNEQTMFVLVSLLEENAALLLEKHYKSVKYEKTDNIVPWNVIKNLYKINDRALQEENLICIIGYLKSKGKCKVALSDTGERIVKFKSKDEGRAEAVAQVDFDIIKLKKAIAKLHLECTQFEKQIQKLQENVQAHVKRKEREKAKKLLAQKSRLNKNLQVKQNALFGMREQLRMVQDAESTKMIADAFSSSATMLKQTYKQQGLTVENIDDVIDKTAEANEMINEIDEALSSGLGRLDDDCDMDELEKELEELNSDSDDIPEPMIVDELPDVPAQLPSTPASGKAKIKRVPYIMTPAT